MITSLPYEPDTFQEECAVFGIWGTSDAAALTALGLHALQHRGQEATGMVCAGKQKFRAHRALGHVGDVFGNHPRLMKKLKGHAAIGHNRYSTTGDPMLRNVQPIYADLAFGGVALAHNGNLTNALTLRQSLVQRGCLFQSTTDTEVIIHLLAIDSSGTVTNRLVNALRQVEGAYSLVLLTQDSLIGVRDPVGVRPLVLGKLGKAYIFASESVAFDIIGAKLIRDVKPGEMVVITKNGVKSLFPFKSQPGRFCIFEYVYFSRPDSLVEGRSVYTARQRIGQELAKEHPVTADVVVPVPDSGVPSAMGFAKETGLDFALGIIRNHYIGRTFIEPTDQIRHLGVRLKHNANQASLNGQRVVLVDDSIVRGTTSKKIVEMVRAAGAMEVHMRIASPPTTHSCFYGVDTPERKQLLAAQHSVTKMKKLIGVDSLAFISLNGLYRALGAPKRHNNGPQFCDACFSGDYPLPLLDQDAGHDGLSVSRLHEQKG